MRCSPFQNQRLFVQAVRNNVCHSEARVFKRGLPPPSSCKTALFFTAFETIDVEFELSDTHREHYYIVY